jgi:hypothetical protein
MSNCRLLQARSKPRIILLNLQGELNPPLEFEIQACQMEVLPANNMLAKTKKYKKHKAEIIERESGQKWAKLGKNSKFTPQNA